MRSSSFGFAHEAVFEAAHQEQTKVETLREGGKGVCVCEGGINGVVVGVLELAPPHHCHCRLQWKRTILPYKTVYLLLLYYCSVDAASCGLSAVQKLMFAALMRKFSVCAVLSDAVAVFFFNGD